MIRRTCIAASVLAILTACSDSSGPADTSATRIVPLADSLRHAFPGDTIALVQVQVTDEHGRPAPRAAVYWTADEGTSITPDASVADDNGVAVTWWVSSMKTGRKVLRAAVAGGAPVVAAIADVVGWQVSAISSGRVVSHTCAIDLGGIACCWGDGTDGLLGNGSPTSASVPVRVLTAQQFTLLRTVSGPTGSGAFTCGLSSTGRIWCWGRNASGQLGNGTTADQPTPVQVLLPTGATATDLFTGSDHACALLTDSSAWCWGSNEEGEVGAGTTEAALVPKLVSGDIAWKSLTLGWATTCGVDTSRRTWCWGNTAGTPLAGTAQFYTTPTLVVSAPPLDVLAVSDWNTCGLDGQALFCFPTNYAGSIDVELGSVVTLIADYKPFYALTTTGVAYYFGGLPNSSYGWRDPPTQFTDGILLKAIGTDSHLPCGIDRPTSTLICWTGWGMGPPGPTRPILPRAVRPPAEATVP